MIRFVDAIAPVRVIGTGWVASAGALIFLGAAKDRRFCLPNTRFLLHQPMGGVRGPATDINIEAIEIIKMKERINRIIARETGQPLEKGRARHGPQLLDECGGGGCLWDGGPDHHQSKSAIESDRARSDSVSPVQRQSVARSIVRPGRVASTDTRTRRATRRRAADRLEAGPRVRSIDGFAARGLHRDAREGAKE